MLLFVVEGSILLVSQCFFCHKLHAPQVKFSSHTCMCFFSIFVVSLEAHNVSDACFLSYPWRHLINSFLCFWTSIIFVTRSLKGSFVAKFVHGKTMLREE